MKTDIPNDIRPLLWQALKAADKKTMQKTWTEKALIDWCCRNKSAVIRYAVKQYKEAEKRMLWTINQGQKGRFEKKRLLIKKLLSFIDEITTS